MFVLVGLADNVLSQLVVSTSFKRDKFPVEQTRIAHRDNLNLATYNNITGGGYFSEVKVGTPAQKTLMHLDTGSSDTWINDINADLCIDPAAQTAYDTGCTEPFDKSKSSTFRLINTDGFDITYLDQRRIRGDYISDALTINGKAVEKQQMGLAKRTVKGIGFMGLGLSHNVATARKYPTMIDNMVEQKLIGRKAFSLWLNDLSSSEGTLLFGGIDTEKYIGSLTTLPVVPDHLTKNITSWSVALTGISMELPNGTTSQLAPESFNASAVLDSGASLTIIPDRMAEELWVKYNVVDAGYGFVDCNSRGADSANHHVAFEFDGVAIRVPLEELVVDVLATTGNTEGMFPFASACLFGIQRNSLFGVDSTNFALLGDTFLRSAYVVYDEANMQVGMAQANLNSSRSNVIELRAGETALPTATGVASQVSTPAPTRTGGRATPSESGNAAARQVSGDWESNEAVVMVLMGISAVVGAMLLSA
ncbi:putative aspartic-type endopeptidase opsB [Colletotrichum spinosum]|uniref:Putative aspartic-type endopeptidase opsB n=1 Tax=Colletotrichum spinosum TaxID=1347390 RepID=A0A4R8QIC9_9PEZI|nr:putative aspartic-type endopeptidase opsB [Colletotrichum spinosum]